MNEIKATQAMTEKTIQKISQEESNLFQPVAYGTAVKEIQEIFHAATNPKTFGAMAARASSVSHSKKKSPVSVNEKETAFYKLNIKNADLNINIRNYKKLFGKNDGAQKFLFFILSKMKDMYCDANGKFSEPVISGSYKELAEYGIFSNKGRRNANEITKNDIDIARRGVIRTMPKLKQIEFDGTCYGRNIHNLSPFKYLGDAPTGYFDIVLEEDFNFNTFLAHFASVPLFFYDLSEKPGYILSKFIEMMPINIEQIAKDGFFPIRVKTLHTWLLLPNIITPAGNTYPQIKRDIIDPIIKAMDEIIKYGQADFPEMKYQFSKNPNKVSAADFLANDSIVKFYPDQKWINHILEQCQKYTSEALETTA